MDNDPVSQSKLAASVLWLSRVGGGGIVGLVFVAVIFVMGSVLRLAVTEFQHIPAVPPKVTIDEAIELAKKFSTEMSGAFVNGILDRIRIELEKLHGSR